MAHRWNHIRNLLCLRLDSLGDVLMTTPALRAFKESSGLRITLLTSPSGAAVAELVPEVDEVMVYDAPWMKATAARSNSRADASFIARLRDRGFDAAAIFTVFSQNPLPAAFFCYLADIPLRLAYCRENPYQLLTEWIPEREPQAGIKHEVQRQLDLAAAVGCHTANERLSLRVPSFAHVHVRRLIKGLGIDLHRPWIVIHPGASAPSRRYPPEQFAAVARLLVEQGYQVVFTGSTGERPMIQDIQAQAAVGTYSLAGRLDLAHLAALLSLAPVLISNNTGPAHVAAAVDTPVVDLYALTNPQHTPWGVAHRVLSYDVPCKYCYKSICPQGHHDCLRRVAPEDVARAAQELFDLTPDRPLRAVPG